MQYLLGERNMALVCADHRDGVWGYLRLRRPGYAEHDLKRWADRLRDTSWDRAFVFFKH